MVCVCVCECAQLQRQHQFLCLSYRKPQFLCRQIDASLKIDSNCLANSTTFNRMLVYMGVCVHFVWKNDANDVDAADAAEIQCSFLYNWIAFYYRFVASWCFHNLHWTQRIWTENPHTVIRGWLISLPFLARNFFFENLKEKEKVIRWTSQIELQKIHERS